jgi:hypothetical protein
MESHNVQGIFLKLPVPRERTAGSVERSEMNRRAFDVTWPIMGFAAINPSHRSGKWICRHIKPKLVQAKGHLISMSDFDLIDDAAIVTARGKRF